MGGISEAVKVCGMASAHGIPVSPHVFPEVHVHLAAAFSGIRAVETTDPAYEVDVLHRLLRHKLIFEAGEVEAPRAPGLGIEIDWPSVERYGG
jgi:L-alanine-DL-glutamate epimerase-like enolase superfamily enzyme